MNQSSGLFALMLFLERDADARASLTLRYRVTLCEREQGCLTVFPESAICRILYFNLV